MDDSQSTFSESELFDDNIEYKGTESQAVDSFHCKASRELEAEFHFSGCGPESFFSGMVMPAIFDNSIQPLNVGEINGLIQRYLKLLCAPV